MNYLSEKAEYNQVKSSYDLSLIDNVINVKNARFDANAKAAQDAVDEFAKIDVISADGSRENYVKGRVQGLVDYLNTSGNVNFERGNVAQQIRQQTSQIIDDKILSDISSTKKYRDFQKEVTKAKEGKNGEYNQANEIDAREVSGFEDWFKDGSKKSYGNLSYSNYVDVATTQDKKAADYAKERGLKDQFLGRTSDAYETTDKYGVKVTREEIQSYLSNTMDVKTKNQLYIDTRQSVGKLDSDKFNTYMSENQLQTNQEFKNRIASLTAEKNTVSDDKKNDYDLAIKETQKALDAGELKYKTGTYNKDEMYSVYSNQRLRDIASAHDVDIITKIDTSDMPFEIMKFNTETQLKIKELELKEKANKIAQAGSQGTMTETPKPVEEKQSTKLQETQQATYRSDQALDAYLKQNSDEYRKMTPEQQWNYKLKLDPTNPLATGNSTTLKNLVNTFQEAQGGYSKIVKEANKKITTDAEISYNNLINVAELNTDNLKATMPLTATLLKSKKNFGSLTNEEKLGITTEFASNYLQYGEGLNSDVRIVYEKVVIGNKATIRNYGTTKSKQVTNLLKSATTEEVGGYWSNVGKVWSGRVSEYLVSPLASAYRDTTYPFRSLISGEQEADKQYEASEQASRERTKYLKDANIKYGKMSLDSWGGEDTNITELEGRDTRDDKDILGRFNTTADSVKLKIDEIAGSYQENRKTGQAFTFSTADKSQAPIAIALRAAVLNSEEKPAIPAGTNDYTVAREGSGYRISFISGAGKTAAYDSAYVAKLPPNVAGMYEESVQSWTNNPNNPNIKLPAKTIPAYVTPSIRNQDIKNLINNRELPAEYKNILTTNPAQTVFATNSELKENAQKKYGQNFYKKNAESVNAILNNKYTAVPYISGGKFLMKIQYTEDGEDMEYYESQPLGEEKDDHGFYLAYMEVIAKLKADKINKLYIAE